MCAFGIAGDIEVIKYDGIWGQGESNNLCNIAIMYDLLYESIGMYSMFQFCSVYAALTCSNYQYICFNSTKLHWQL
jgi:hypothetical protein